MSKGTYLRRDGERIRRFRCRGCRVCFCETTASPAYRVRRPEIDAPVARLLAAGHGIRATARLLGVNRKTVQRRLRAQACALVDGFRNGRRSGPALDTSGATR